MKLSIIVLITLVLPLIGNAGTLLYPAVGAKTFFKSFESVNNLFKMGLDPASFVLKETKTSLLGKHYHYQHVINGHEVSQSELVISVGHSGEILKVYNNVQINVTKSFDTSIPLISETMALENIWTKLNVDGSLNARPLVKLIYEKNKLVYQVYLSTSSPRGQWRSIVDAQNGDVLSIDDESLPRMKTQVQRVATLKRLPLHRTFSSALKAFEAKEVKSFFVITLASGTGQVFNPNPSVSLGRWDLQDNTEASVFVPAYRNVDLKEVTFSNGVYSLRGSKVALIDFEAPTAAPVSTKDGHWIFERGQSGLNDVMTYFHIDQSIRYIESLGFTGAHAVFPKQIEVDSNAVDGEDNSYYSPANRRLAFGHGCVDDNEDAEVILHELGHAIQFHINSSWYGGDTGAMGEGFGDYWAASYSATTEHGLEGNFNWVFKFDGHNTCWAGRKLNSFTPVYDPSKTYSAHAQVNGGVSDEVWSTPLFQAFLELYKAGVSKSDIDKVILEAHFGLGSGIKIPVMAKAIVRTAKQLFPSKKYDEIFLKHFKKQNILQ
jgi:hypothetical protein